MTTDANGQTIRPGDVVWVTSNECSYVGGHFVVAAAPYTPDLPFLSLTLFAAWLREKHNVALEDVFSTRCGATLFGKFVVVENRQPFQRSEKTFEQLLNELNA